MVFDKARKTFSHEKSTLSHSVKNRYIVRSRHQAICNDRFMPVNRSQAKSMVKKETIHDDGEPSRDDAFYRSMQTIYQTHGSTFKNTNYITQDI